MCTLSVYDTFSVVSYYLLSSLIIYHYQQRFSVFEFETGTPLQNTLIFLNTMVHATFRYKAIPLYKIKIRHCKITAGFECNNATLNQVILQLKKGTRIRTAHCMQTSETQN